MLTEPPCGQDVVDDADRACGLAHVVMLAPMVEPAVPVLGAEEGLAVAARAQQLGRLLRARPERRRREHPVERAAVEHEVGRTIGRVQEFGDAARDERVAEPPEVGGVVAVAAELVLELHGDDGAAIGGLQRCEAREQLVEPGGDFGQVPRIAGTWLQPRDARQPGGEPAVVPLGADVGPGSHDHVEPEFTRERDEPLDVAPAREVRGRRPALVEVPCDVGVDRVEAE